MTTPVQNPLTILFPIKPDKVDELRALLKKPVDGASALSTTGIVHFARIFVFEEGNPSRIPANTAAVITTYDGDFRAYVQAFVEDQGASEFFNFLLTVVDDPDAAGLVPVQANAQDFADLAAKYDPTNGKPETWGQWFSAVA